MELHVTVTEFHLRYGLPAAQQVNAPRLNPCQTGQYSIYLPRRDGRL